MMKPTTLILIATLVCGCATQEGQTVADAVDDFIHVAELEELDVVRKRSNDQFNYRVLSDEYIILQTRRDYYLVQIVRPCRELWGVKPTPDIRREANTLRPRVDTIRGCRIKAIYAIDEAQSEELKYLGKAPGEKTG